MRPRHYVVFPDGAITRLMPKNYARAYSLLYGATIKTHDPDWLERLGAKAQIWKPIAGRWMRFLLRWAIIATVSILIGYYFADCAAHWSVGG